MSVYNRLKKESSLFSCLFEINKGPVPVYDFLMLPPPNGVGLDTLGVAVDGDLGVIAFLGVLPKNTLPGELRIFIMKSWLTRIPPGV